MVDEGVGVAVDRADDDAAEDFGLAIPPTDVRGRPASPSREAGSIGGKGGDFVVASGRRSGFSAPARTGAFDEPADIAGGLARADVEETMEDLVSEEGVADRAASMRGRTVFLDAGLSREVQSMTKLWPARAMTMGKRAVADFLTSAFLSSRQEMMAPTIVFTSIDSVSSCERKRISNHASSSLRRIGFWDSSGFSKPEMRESSPAASAIAERVASAAARMFAF